MKRKSAVRVFQITMVCFLALSAAFFMKTEAYASTRGAYQAYVKKHFSTKKYPYRKCFLYDINKDGTKEMIVQYESGVRYACQLYTYKKGKVKKLHKGEFCGAGGMYCMKGKKEIIIAFTNGASDNEYCSYKISGGKLKKVRRYRAVYNDRTGKATFSFNKKKISQAAYDRFVRKLKRIPERTL